jgi:hypothetical protein
MVRAAAEGDSARVAELLRDGVPPNARTWRPEGEIHGGVIMMKEGRLVFKRGAWTSGPEIMEITALQAAAGGGHRGTVEILLIAGADIDATGLSFLGRTALQAAAENGHGEIVRLLLEAGADVNALALSREGRTALQAAAGGGIKRLSCYYCRPRQMSMQWQGE